MAVNTKSKTIAAENTFTDSITVPGSGVVDVINTSSGSMTLTLQVYPYGQSDPVDVDTMTASGRYEFNGLGGTFRVGCKTGDYTSGIFDVNINAPMERT